MFSPEVLGHTIVLLGDYNPMIFQPAWFADEEILRPGEAKAAKIEIINPNVVKFTLEWLELTVTRDRFIAATLSESTHEVTCDLVRSTFESNLSTPTKMLGLNYDLHIKPRKGKYFSDFANRLAPKEKLPETLRDRVVPSLTFEFLRSKSDYDGKITVRVEPSAKFENAIFISLNDHYLLKPRSSGYWRSEDVVDILENHWTASKDASYSIIEDIMGAVNE